MASKPKTRIVKLSDLLPDKANTRVHPSRNKGAIKSSLERFGPARSAVVDGSGVIRAGNGTVEQAIAAGLTEAVVVESDGKRLVVVERADWSEAEAEAYGITDNRTSDLSSFDPAALSAAVQRIEPTGAIEFQTLGWTPNELQEFRPPIPPPSGGEPDAQPPKTDVEPTTQPGDLWRLGQHLLLCGDSFAEDSMRRLLGSARAAMVLTDPPYAIYGSSTGIASDITDDRMVRPFFENLFRLLKSRTVEFGHVYVHCDWRSWSAIWESAKRARLTTKNCLVWDKKGAGLGANYANTHEFVGFFANLPEQTAMGDRPAGQRPVHKPNILRYDRVRGDEREHNAAKPVAMLEELIANSSEPEDLVLDTFNGSGSTLIACERSGRRCRAVEVEPRMCDVTVARWERMTGGKAERAQ